MFRCDLKMGMQLEIFRCHNFDTVVALCQFLAFFHLLNHLTKGPDFWYTITSLCDDHSDDG